MTVGWLMIAIYGFLLGFFIVSFVMSQRGWGKALDGWDRAVTGWKKTTALLKESTAFNDRLIEENMMLRRENMMLRMVIRREVDVAGELRRKKVEKETFQA